MPPLARKHPPQEKPRSESRTGTPHEDAERVAARQLFEPEMIRIPAGKFLMGSDPEKDRNASEDEQPQHTLYLPDYALAKTPVTNAQYAVFVQATGYGKPQHWTEGWPPRGKEDHPVVHVSWDDAMIYCRWLSEVTGKAYSLPSEAEWEKAARGTDGRIYPWGNQWERKRCNCREGGQGDTTSVGAYPQGASPYGILDMAGNVWELTRTLWGENLLASDFEYPYLPHDGREDLDAPDNIRHIRRGGMWDDDRRGVRCASRHRHFPNLRYWFFGFRVVMHP